MQKLFVVNFGNSLWSFLGAHKPHSDGEGLDDGGLCCMDMDTTRHGKDTVARTRHLFGYVVKSALKRCLSEI